MEVTTENNEIEVAGLKKKAAILSSQLEVHKSINQINQSNYQNLKEELITLNNRIQNLKIQQEEMGKKSSRKSKQKNRTKLINLFKRKDATISSQQENKNLKINALYEQNIFTFTAFGAQLKSLKIATITDEFSFKALNYECNLFNLSLMNWEEELVSFKPDILLVESAWLGKNNAWSKKISTASNEIQRITSWCNANSVPSVFWNKEDPTHFQTFIETAKLFNYIFTTDLDCIASYKHILGHNNVFLLPFACQPQLHNPIEKYTRKNAISFAGSYYSRYVERKRTLKDFITSLPSHAPIEIYDRNYGTSLDTYKFPASFQPYIVGSLEYNSIDVAYKGYEYSINLNSIKDSPTMFARRVYELMASNTYIISNSSLGMQTMFGDLVSCSDSGDEHLARINKLQEEPNASSKLKLAALRKIMREHTYQDRLAYLVSKVQDMELGPLLPAVHVLAFANNRKQLENILTSFSQQNYQQKKISVFLNFSYKSKTETNVNFLPVKHLADMSLEALGNLSDWVSVFIPEDYYGPNYLVDLMLATRYTDRPIIGKQGYFESKDSADICLQNVDKIYRLENGLPVRSSAIKLFALTNLSLKSLVLDAAIATIDSVGLSIDPFNYCKNVETLLIQKQSKDQVNDIPGLNEGAPLAKFYIEAENVVLSSIPATTLNSLISDEETPSGIVCTKFEEMLFLQSNLNDNTPHYFFLSKTFSPQELQVNNNQFYYYLEAIGQLNLKMVVAFFDVKMKKIAGRMGSANKNNIVDVPKGTAFIRLGFKISNRGEKIIRAIWFGQKYKSSNANRLEKSLCLTRAKFFHKTDTRIKVAAIMDDFTYHSYAPECNLLQIEPENFIEQLTAFQPDLFFIESAWQGKDSLWKLMISNNSPEIRDCVEWCKQRGIPVLFWNKEDPAHFHTFLPLAKTVDFIFTTDMDRIPQYKLNVGHYRVYLLPFAAQPLVHNPIEEFARKDSFNFAGSYYLRYPERQRDFANIIQACTELRPVEIYDRNHGREHPHYMFPETYKPLIIGSLPFEEINNAYKGYRYGINMNSVKQSQTMFARRAFELLASNTIVVSNFSQGLKVFFGDIVISSDDPKELKTKLDVICKEEITYRKIRLLGLRKVMTEHTYEHRLQYIKSKLIGEEHFKVVCPPVLILGIANCLADEQMIIRTLSEQKYENYSCLLLRRYNDIEPDTTDRIKPLSHVDDFIKAALHSLENFKYIAVIGSNNYYGPNYLLDLVLAMSYANAEAVGKGTYFNAKNGVVSLENETKQYQKVNLLNLDASMLNCAAIAELELPKWCKEALNTTIAYDNMMSVDEFNFCRNVENCALEEIKSKVDDFEIINNGVSFEKLIKTADNLKNIKEHLIFQEDTPSIDAGTLYRGLAWPKSTMLKYQYTNSELTVYSNLPSVTYIYFQKNFTRKELNLEKNNLVYIECFKGDAQLVFLYLDEVDTKVGTQICKSLHFSNTLVIPSQCVYIRFGIVLQPKGTISIKKLTFGKPISPPNIPVGLSKTLLLVKNYPSYDDLYKYGFVHSRVRAYKQRGKNVDVFRLEDSPAQPFREFEGVNVISGNARLLDTVLSQGEYNQVLVHILDDKMWAVLAPYLDKLNVIVWAHGAEIQIWQRRSYEFEFMSADEIVRQKNLSNKRMQFWQSILNPIHENLHLVFVSEYFKNEIFTDMDISLNKESYSVIHNPIDTSLFSYRKKDKEQRKKILSIRPFVSRKYANDLTVNAILELSKKPFFNDLEFRIIGDGELFDDILEPLRHFPNIVIDKTFLTQSQIATLHLEYGVFLCPTRLDSQGVSRDEAMSSGLVPITNAVTAIPEFVDATCGLLVPDEDYLGLAEKIEFLYNHPVEFLQLSENAANRVRTQTDSYFIILQELKLINKHCSVSFQYRRVNTKQHSAVDPNSVHQQTV